MEYKQQLVIFDLIGTAIPGADQTRKKLEIEAIRNYFNNLKEEKIEEKVNLYRAECKKVDEATGKKKLKKQSYKDALGEVPGQEIYDSYVKMQEKEIGEQQISQVIMDIIKYLHELKIGMCILTRNEVTIANAFVEHNKLSEYFVGIFGDGDKILTTNKPNPKVIKEITKQLAQQEIIIIPQNIYMIGNSIKSDMICAKEANCGSRILVGDGQDITEEDEKDSRFYHVKNQEELYELVKSLFPQQLVQQPEPVQQQTPKPNSRRCCCGLFSSWF